jgi:hypothetical protein
MVHKRDKQRERYDSTPWEDTIARKDESEIPIGLNTPNPRQAAPTRMHMKAVLQEQISILLRSFCSS